MMLTFVTSVSAQVQYYKTTAYAQASVYNGRYVWGDWKSSDMNLTIDLNRDVITIYSPRTQVYRVLDIANGGQAYYDNDGGKNVKFYIVDQDGDRGEIRLRIERNGNSQVYVDFSNIAWVYNVKRIA